MKLLALIAALASVAVAGADASAFLATDKNFDSAVMNSGKHVFVKYLAPWCVRCDAVMGVPVANMCRWRTRASVRATRGMRARGRGTWM